MGFWTSAYRGCSGSYWRRGYQRVVFTRILLSDACPIGAGHLGTFELMTSDRLQYEQIGRCWVADVASRAGLAAAKLPVYWYLGRMVGCQYLPLPCIKDCLSADSVEEIRQGDSKATSESPATARMPRHQPHSASSPARTPPAPRIKCGEAAADVQLHGSPRRDWRKSSPLTAAGWPIFGTVQIFLLPAFIQLAASHGLLLTACEADGHMYVR